MSFTVIFSFEDFLLQDPDHLQCRQLLANSDFTLFVFIYSWLLMKPTNEEMIMKMCKILMPLAGFDPMTTQIDLFSSLIKSAKRPTVKYVIIKLSNLCYIGWGVRM
jgi:hypothetical protein